MFTYERLGEARLTAVTWGNIADIAALRGDWESAAELQRRRLDVHKRLGDLEGIAATHWNLAQIDLQRQDYESAAPRVRESFQILRHLQRPDGIAVVGLTHAQLLLAAGLTDDARQVLDESLAAATTIGSAELMRQLNELRLTLPDEGDEPK
jgi:tetratricopeptide (TPR) repeat protein